MVFSADISSSHSAPGSGQKRGTRARVHERTRTQSKCIATKQAPTPPGAEDTRRRAETWEGRSAAIASAAMTSWTGCLNPSRGARGNHISPYPRVGQPPRPTSSVSLRARSDRLVGRGPGERFETLPTGQGHPRQTHQTAHWQPFGSQDFAGGSSSCTRSEPGLRPV